MKKATAIIALLLIICLSLTACSKAESLTGTWKYSEDGVTISMTFNSDGTGKIEALGGLMSVEYAYKIDDDTIIFHELNQELLGSDPYNFKIKGDELSLTAGGDVMVLTKEK